jgi:hypothetical protein
MLGFDGLDGLKLLHVANSIDNGVNFAHKGTPVLQGAFGSAQFYFPTGIEVIATGQDNIGVVLK